MSKDLLNISRLYFNTLSNPPQDPVARGIYDSLRFMYRRTIRKSMVEIIFN